MRTTRRCSAGTWPARSSVFGVTTSQRYAGPTKNVRRRASWRRPTRRWPRARPGCPGSSAATRRTLIMPEEIEELRSEARYRRERYDLLRAKAYGGRLVVPARMAELERAALGAE